MSAVKGVPLESAKADTDYGGRLIETAVGAHLMAGGVREPRDLFYWRDAGLEVDYVVETPRGLIAIEVESGRTRDRDRRGMDAFVTRYQQATAMLVGQGGAAVDDLLTRSV